MKTPKRKMTHRKQHNNEHGYEHMDFSSSHEDDDRENVCLRCILSMEQTS